MRFIPTLLCLLVCGAGSLASVATAESIDPLEVISEVVAELTVSPQPSTTTVSPVVPQLTPWSDMYDQMFAGAAGYGLMCRQRGLQNWVFRECDTCCESSYLQVSQGPSDVASYIKDRPSAFKAICMKFCGI